MEDNELASASIEERVEKVQQRAAEQRLQGSDEETQSDFIDDSWSRK